jgi:hypothetical protein
MAPATIAQTSRSRMVEEGTVGRRRPKGRNRIYEPFSDIRAARSPAWIRDVFLGASADTQCGNGADQPPTTITKSYSSRLPTLWGIVPAILVGLFDNSMKNSRWRVLQTTLFGFVVDFISHCRGTPDGLLACTLYLALWACRRSSSRSLFLAVRKRGMKQARACTQ